uniref:peptidylprolyl isomerase n=1 Tax=Cacopsylla melanoneura TaxID=428564 RepID=A0A8D8X685_9HEMI
MGEVIDLTGDGGVLKEIKTPGVGDSTPSAGCKVKVHYTGTLLDGTVFDSSKTRGEPFEFDLGKGQVIKAWDRGIATMKKDEVAVFTCKPDYAYGKQGSPPTIPADATLVFEVEMISWEAEDISPNHDGGMRREILEEGGSFSTPKDGAPVEITLKAECDNKVFQEGNFSFILGEGCEIDLPDSVDKALEKFKLKEKSRITVQPQHLWKGKGNEKLGLPANKPAVYTITLNNFEKVKDTWQLNSDEKLEQGKLLKERGTDYFKKEKFELSVRNYKKAIPFLDFDGGFEGDQESERKKTLTACHLNAAMCYLKLNQPIPARDECDKAIELDANNEKAFFRRGNAYLELNEPELAEKDFVRVLQIDANNKAAAQKLAQTKQKLKEQKQREKQVYANMFDKFAKHDTEKSWLYGWWNGEEVEVEKEEFIETEEDFEEEKKLKQKQKEYFMKKAAEMREKREQMLKEKGELEEGEKGDGEKCEEEVEKDTKDDGGKGENEKEPEVVKETLNEKCEETKISENPVDAKKGVKIDNKPPAEEKQSRENKSRANEKHSTKSGERKTQNSRNDPAKQTPMSKSQMKKDGKEKTTKIMDGKTQKEGSNIEKQIQGRASENNVPNQGISNSPSKIERNANESKAVNPTAKTNEAKTVENNTKASLTKAVKENATANVAPNKIQNKNQQNEGNKTGNQNQTKKPQNKPFDPKQANKKTNKSK